MGFGGEEINFRQSCIVPPPLPDHTILVAASVKQFQSPSHFLLEFLSLSITISLYISLFLYLILYLSILVVFISSLECMSDLSFIYFFSLLFFSYSITLLYKFFSPSISKLYPYEKYHLLNRMLSFI